MKHASLFIQFAIIFTCAVLTGCATPSSYDYTALREAKPRSIVVIPPANSTVEVDAPYIYMSTLSKPLAEKGYYVFPVAVVEQFMQENGLPTPAEMNTVPLDKIHDNIGADAVLYVNIEDWGQKFKLTSSEAVVKARLKMIDARTGAVLWQSLAYASQPSNNNGGGLLGAVMGAVVDQIAGSISDATPDVARVANKAAFDNKNRGLLPGPYQPEVK